MTTGENRARIKVWAGANVGSGIVKDITFSNFNETKVDHPIVIDQVRVSPPSFDADRRGG